MALGQQRAETFDEHGHCVERGWTEGGGGLEEELRREQLCRIGEHVEGCALREVEHSVGNKAQHVRKRREGHRAALLRRHRRAEDLRQVRGVAARPPEQAVVRVWDRFRTARRAAREEDHSRALTTTTRGGLSRSTAAGAREHFHSHVRSHGGCARGCLPAELVEGRRDEQRPALQLMQLWPQLCSGRTQVEVERDAAICHTCEGADEVRRRVVREDGQQRTLG
eukprot:scaffold81740_cov61-Phaeocystis_antarctica.AAC.3